MVDHDRLFKELLATFFLDFLELFAPGLAREVDRASVEFLEKELFTDVLAGERHEVDLLVKLRLRGQDSCVLVHVESQAAAVAEFGRRMFRYFARIEARHGLPVYPVAVFSYERPRRRQPSLFAVRLPGLQVLRFRFRAVQLNRLDWRAFLGHPNPIAAALMARMRMRPRDRPRVKLECLRMLATLRLDPARMKLVSGFFDTYLRLTLRERRLFDSELARMPGDQKESLMEIVTSWMEEGIEKGMQKGVEIGIQRGVEQGVQIGIKRGVEQGVEIGIKRGVEQGVQIGIQRGVEQGVQIGIQRGVEQGLEIGIQRGRQEGVEEGRRDGTLNTTVRLLARRFGPIPAELRARIGALPSGVLDALADELLEFASLADLERWLDSERT